MVWFRKDLSSPKCPETIQVWFKSTKCPRLSWLVLLRSQRFLAFSLPETPEKKEHIGKRSNLTSIDGSDSWLWQTSSYKWRDMYKLYNPYTWPKINRFYWVLSPYLYRGYNGCNSIYYLLIGVSTPFKPGFWAAVVIVTNHPRKKTKKVVISCLCQNAAWNFLP